MPSFSDPISSSPIRISLRAVFVAICIVAVIAGYIAPFAQIWNAKYMLALGNTALGVFIGAFGYSAFLFYRRHSIVGQCGQLLLRLPLRQAAGHQWRLTLLIIAIPSLVVADFLLNGISERDDFNPGIPGIAAGYLIAKLVLSFLWQRANVSVELCQNGAILRGSQFAPWADFKRYRWVTDERLQLVMHFSTVEICPPAELREFTDEILRVHLPSEQVPVKV
jgi:hypothetical protein